MSSADDLLAYRRRVADAVPRVRDGGGSARRDRLRTRSTSPTNGRAAPGHRQLPRARRQPRRVAVPPSAATTTPFRIIGAHTDSPNLRVKPHPDVERAGAQLLAAEVYGGALFNSWLDRDLGIAGRVCVARRTARARQHRSRRWRASRNWRSISTATSTARDSCSTRSNTSSRCGESAAQIRSRSAAISPPSSTSTRTTSCSGT